MAGQSTIFPIFLRAEYSDSTALQRFQSDAMRAAQAASGEIKKVGAALDGIFKARQLSGGALDLGVSGLRELIAAQQQAVAVSREVANATLAAAKANGEFDKSLTRTAKAALDAAKADQAKLDTLTKQLPLLERVQAELDKGTIALQAQLKAEQNLANFRKTANINDGASRIISGQGAIDRAALSTATLDSVLGRTRTSNPAVDQQRAAQAKQAAQLAAQEAAAAREMAAAQEELARAAARLTAQIDPLTAAQQRYDATLAEARRLLQEGAISTQQFANAQAFASAELRRVQNDVNGVTEAQARLRAAEEATAAALRERSAAVAALKAQINPAAAAQEDFNQKVAFAKAALDRGELSQKEYAQAVRLASAALREAGQAEVAAAAARNGLTTATKAGTTARGNVINSIRSERTAFIQLGQQLQDVTVQAQLGTNAFIIMGQQLPQAAFALSGLADSADRTKAAVGRIATFLSGPWGAAIFVALAVLGPFVQKLLESKDAADESGRAQRSLTEVLNDTTSSYQEVTKALDDYNRAQERSREVTISSLAQQARAIAQNLSEAISIREKTKARIADLLAADKNLRATGDRGAFAFGAEAGVLQASIADQDKQIERLKTGAANVTVQVASEIARIQSDGAARIAEGFKVLRERANKELVADPEALTARLIQLNRAEQAALEAERKSGRSSRGGASAVRQAAREADRLAMFGEKAAEQIKRINERFDEQPRLVDQAAQATRQLDDLIAELGKKKPVDFEKMIEDAERAKGVVADALQRPVEELLRNSEDRLRIEGLISQGRVDEAVALQEILRLEQQIGDLTDQQRADIRDQILFEQQKTRELRVQAELMELQADVARSVADSLRDLFSGRGSFGDLIRNFRQSLADLQGARLFEDLFGPAFRQLEEELRGNTPQGRANARATKEIEKFADTGRRAGNAVTAFADVIERVTARIAANDNPAIGAAGAAAGRSISGAGSAFSAALSAAGIGSGITVTGDRTPKVDVSRMSSKEIADRISKSTVEGFLGPLEDVLGPRFFAGLSGVLTSALSGFVQGGKVGGVLGGLQGITALIPGLGGVSEGFGALGQGAAIGNQIAGITKALGIGGSSTGAAIGGALGTPFGPAGQIVGSILGNVVGGLLKSPKRGSATIGGVGGSLGITGTVGNSAALRDTANTLAGSVLESVNSIARQLGATVDSAAGSVSIGQRKSNLRVDPSGRGATKIGNGAIDFGDDTEAAVAFAVKNLIEDGVIKGLRASETRLLQAGKDVNAALQDVLTFRAVFDELKSIKDPVGAAIDSLNREFTSLIELFTRAGASTEEFAQLEELYNLKRADAIKEASDRVVGSLRQLLNDLKIGDSGLSLRDRQANALTQFNGLAARVASGDTAAFDDFADISQQLLDIERQLFGSTQSYFDRLSQVTALTEQAIAGQTNVTSIGSARPSPFDDAPTIDRSIDTMTQTLGGKLDQLNANFIAVGNALTRSGFAGAGGSGFDNTITASRIANF